MSQNCLLFPLGGHHSALTKRNTCTCHEHKQALESMKQLTIKVLCGLGKWLNDRAHSRAELAWIRYEYMCPFDNEPIDHISQTYGFDWIGERMMKLSYKCNMLLWDLSEPPF